MNKHTESVHGHNHAHHHKHHNVVVNGHQKEVRKSELTYHDVCKLAFPEGQFGENFIYNIDFSFPDGTKGSMVKHESVEVRNGIIFDVSRIDKGFMIFINTREFTIHQEVLTYQELVQLAFPGDVPNPNKVYDITYSNEHGADGRVGVGGNVKLKEGMVFHVGLTNRS